MDITKNEFWFCSQERYTKDLPVLCKFVKTLQNENDKEVILIECGNQIDIYGTKYLILVPKHVGYSFFEIGTKEDIVFALVFDGSKYIYKDQIDLSPWSKIIIDWGAISGSYEVANKWQMGLERIKLTEETMKKFEGKIIEIKRKVSD